MNKEEDTAPISAEESETKSQEPNEEDIIYELPNDPESRLRELVTEMGAETLLEIIRDNRNAAIRQILSEVEARRTPMQSGVSAARSCNSIFDLAALA